jgi:hypothetical protein
MRRGVVLSAGKALDVVRQGGSVLRVAYVLSWRRRRIEMLIDGVFYALTSKAKSYVEVQCNPVLAELNLPVNLILNHRRRATIYPAPASVTEVVMRVTLLTGMTGTDAVWLPKRTRVVPLEELEAEIEAGIRSD